MAKKERDPMKIEALAQAIAYHRCFDNGMATALAQARKTVEGPKPDCVVATAKVFHSFLVG